MIKNIRLYPSDIFKNDFQKKELKHSAVSGSVALMVSQGASIGLSLISTVVLARLLTPDDFGTVGMVAVFVNFLIMFKDSGLSTATIQRDNITSDQVSTLFWINVLISTALGLVILISSPLLAAFYKKPELTAVTAVLSISFVFQGFAIQHSALMQRHLKFTAIAINNIISHFVYLVVAILMALLDFRYWALIGGAMARTLCTLLLTYYYCPWIPGKIKRGAGVRSMLKFGGHITVSYFVGYLSRNLDRILIGKIAGAASLGLYSRAFTLFMQPLTQVKAPITRLALPVLSSLKNDPKRYQNYFAKLLDLSVSIALPISVYCFLESEFLIRTLLGPDWMDAVPVFRILSVGGVFVAMSATPGAVMLSHGYSKRYMRLTMINAIIITLSFLVGSFFDVKGISIAYSVSSFLIMIPLISFGFKKTPIRLRLILTSIAGPLLAAIIAALLAIFLTKDIPLENIASHITLGLIFFLVYTVMTLIRPETRKTVRSIWSSIRSKK